MCPSTLINKVGCPEDRSSLETGPQSPISSKDGTRLTSALCLHFPWGSREVWCPEDLTPRENKYVRWVLASPLPSRTRNRRLLSLLGKLTYRQARWPVQKLKEIAKWHYKTG